MQLTSDTRIIVYGAGYCGAMFVELLLNNDIKPVYVFDKDRDKQKQTVFGIRIMEPHYEPTDIVVVSILIKGKVFQSICKYLVSLGYPEEQIVHVYDLDRQEELFYKQRLVIQPNRDLVTNNLCRWKQLESKLADDESCEVLQSAMLFLQRDTYVDFPSHAIEEQYFAYDIYSKRDDEFVVDCGGFKGDVMKLFLDNHEGRFSKYFLIEPDKKYNEYIEQNIGEYDKNRIHIVNKALSNENTMFYVSNYMNMNSVVTKERTAYSSQKVESTRLDDLLADEKCTFLKIDIEGFELEMLQGAKEFIVRNTPVVAIAAYHHEDDVLNISRVLLEYNSEYTLFLRSYMNYQEMVLYAIPRERLLGGN